MPDLVHIQYPRTSQANFFAIVLEYNHCVRIPERLIAEQVRQMQNPGNPINPNDPNNPNNQQGQPNNGMLAPAEQMAEQKVNEAIDQFAQKLPGGENYAQQAKNAADGVLKNLEQQLEQQAEQHKGDVGNILGNIFHKKD